METQTKEITIEGLQDLFKSQKQDVESLVTARLNDWKASYQVDNGPAKSAEVVPAPVAKMNDPLSGIAKMDVMGVPIGQAAIGGFVAVLATEMVDGFLSKQGAMTRGLAKLVAAFAAAKYGKKLVGDSGSKAVALLITFDALRDFIPFDVYAQKLTSKITGKTMTAGLAGNNQIMRQMSTSQAANYYSRAQGR